MYLIRNNGVTLKTRFFEICLSSEDVKCILFRVFRIVLLFENCVLKIFRKLN